MQVRLTTTLGDILVELLETEAPNTVSNFVTYVKEGFYDGTVFHRVIDGFMIQGGGHESGLARKPANPPIKNEADNGLSNLTGTLAMARTNDPHSASSQFFINVADNTFLDHKAPTSEGWGYCVFGRVVDGMDVVDAIRGVDTQTAGGMQDVPVEEVKIKRAELVT